MTSERAFATTIPRLANNSGLNPAVTIASALAANLCSFTAVIELCLRLVENQAANKSRKSSAIQSGKQPEFTFLSLGGREACNFAGNQPIFATFIRQSPRPQSRKTTQKQYCPLVIIRNRFSRGFDSIGSRINLAPTRLTSERKYHGRNSGEHSDAPTCGHGHRH